MASVKWTDEQQAAIDKKGSNILVAAAAGSGKTAVLVERIIKKIIVDRVDIDKILVVTFTNAAASEMRERILEAIYKKDYDENIDEQSGFYYKAARYKPLQYIKEDRTIQIRKKIEEEGIKFDFFQRSQKNLADFMRRLLVHRFESSVNAFKISLENMINASKNILNWIDVRKTIPIYKKGDLPDIESLIET